jgi:pimeloyl-ACP methyl ester carboxylesterase
VVDVTARPDDLPEYQGGDGPPLLLLHGITATYRVWQPVIPALERHHWVIAPTLAGHAGGPLYEPGVPVTIASLTDAIERRLDELSIERPHVAGNSLGGWIALELARRGRAGSVVAFSPACFWGSMLDLARVSALVLGGHQVSTRGANALHGLVARPRSRRWMFAYAHEHGERLTPFEAMQVFTDNAGCTILDGFLRSVWAGGPLVGPVDTAGSHVRIAWPNRDRTLPFKRYGSSATTVVPNAELVRLPGVGHVPMLDDPELVARTILEVTQASARAQVSGSA